MMTDYAGQLEKQIESLDDWPKSLGVFVESIPVFVESIPVSNLTLLFVDYTGHVTFKAAAEDEDSHAVIRTAIGILYGFLSNYLISSVDDHAWNTDDFTITVRGHRVIGIEFTLRRYVR